MQKFRYFDANTEWYSLYLFPAILGAAFGLGLPYLNYWAHGIVGRPIAKMRSQDDAYSHDRLKQKNKWAAERNSEKDLHEKRLLAEAKVDQEVENLEDSEVRQRVQDEIESLRQENNDTPEARSKGAKQQKEISKFERFALELLAKDGLIVSNQDDPFSGLEQIQINAIGAALNNFTGSKINKLRIRIEFNSAVAKLVSMRLAQKEKLYNSSSFSESEFKFTPTSEGFSLLDNAPYF